MATDNWLAEVREQLEAHQRGAPNPADWHIPRLLAAAEALAELVALRDQQLAHHWKADAAWERARAALRGGGDDNTRHGG